MGEGVAGPTTILDGVDPALAMRPNLDAFFLCLLLGLFAAGLLGGVLLLLVNDQPCPALFLVPLEASEVGFFQFVIRLTQISLPR